MSRIPTVLAGDAAVTSVQPGTNLRVDLGPVPVVANRPVSLERVITGVGRT